MNDKPTIKLHNPEGEKDGADILDFFLVLTKNKRLLTLFPLSVCIVATLLSLLMADVYRATTRLLPPQQVQSGAAAILAQLGGAAGAVAGVAGLKTPNDLYIGMLKSRTVADKIISRFDLKNVYEQTTFEDTRKILEKNTIIASGKDGLISIEVEDQNKQRVAPMANAYVEELLKLTKVLAVTEAAQRRLFFEQQLEQSKAKLAAAEQSVTGALDTHGVISVEGESRAIVENVGRLRAQVSAKEIQLASMNAFVTENNYERKRVEAELTSLLAELSKLQNGAHSTEAPSTGRSQAGLENIKKLRDVKYYQMLYELLSKQYEVARLDEARNAPLIQVLDVALEPERKFKPSRALIVASSTVLALFLALVIAFIREIGNRAASDPRRAARLAQLRTHLRFK